MKYKLPRLHFQPREISDFLSEEQLEAHYQGHHKAYIEKVNKAVASSSLQSQSLLDLMRGQKRINKSLANNAAQAWNHTFFWNCIGKKNQNVSPLFCSLLSNRGCNTDGIQKKFVKKGVELFGSGYVWLVLSRDSSLKVISTRNARNPLQDDHDCLPILTADVWEHSYYLDYKMKREEYLRAFWEHINWKWIDAILSDRTQLSQVEESMLTLSEDSRAVQRKLNKNNFDQAQSNL